MTTSFQTVLMESTAMPAIELEQNPCNFLESLAFNKGSQRIIQKILTKKYGLLSSLVFHEMVRGPLD